MGLLKGLKSAQSWPVSSSCAYVQTCNNAHESLQEGLQPKLYWCVFSLRYMNFWNPELNVTISAPNISQSYFNVFLESQSVLHVNVTGDWKVVELGCMSLSVKCLLGAVMCLCVCLHNCVHSSLQLCAYCAGLSVYGCTFLNYISATKLPSFPGILPFSQAASRLSVHAWVEKAACIVLFQTSYLNPHNQLQHSMSFWLRICPALRQDIWGQDIK